MVEFGLVGDTMHQVDERVADRRPRGADRHLPPLPRPHFRGGAVITLDEIARSLQGAWLLFLDRANAMRLFDASYGGFWRSFQAVVLVAPAYELTVLADRRALLAAAGADDVQRSGLRGGPLAGVRVRLGHAAAAARGAGAASSTSAAAIRPTSSRATGRRCWRCCRSPRSRSSTSPGCSARNSCCCPSLVALAIALRFSYVAARRALGRRRRRGDRLRGARLSGEPGADGADRRPASG